MTTTVSTLVADYRATYGRNSALTTFELRRDAAALKALSEPAIGTKRRTELQKQLARSAVSLTRAARLIERIEAEGLTL